MVLKYNANSKHKKLTLTICLIKNSEKLKNIRSKSYEKNFTFLKCIGENLFYVMIKKNLNRGFALIYVVEK